MGKNRRHIVSFDTSSAILLYKAADNSGNFLEKIFSRYDVLFSDGVFFEITREGYIGADFFQKSSDGNSLKVISPEVSFDPLPEPEKTVFSKLDKGEQQAISLLLGHQADFLVTDDGRAAKFCKQNNILFTNALIMLRILHETKQLPDQQWKSGRDSLLAMAWYSRKIVEFGLTAPMERFSKFYLSES